MSELFVALFCAFATCGLCAVFYWCVVEPVLNIIKKKKD